MKPLSTERSTEGRRISNVDLIKELNELERLRPAREDDPIGGGSARSKALFERPLDCCLEVEVFEMLCSLCVWRRERGANDGDGGGGLLSRLGLDLACFMACSFSFFAPFLSCFLCV
jgi:hypothetical protein